MANRPKLIMFDLDGTLIKMDAENFEKNYTKLIVKYFSQWMAVEDASKSLKEAVTTMATVNNGETNKKKFYRCFEGKTTISLEEIMAKESEFYETQFHNVKSHIERNDNMFEAVEVLKQKKVDMLIATNPLFPQIATYTRMKWGGYNTEDFKLITTFEDCHYTKFHSEYYQNDILKRLDLKPEDCLMVGNNTMEDGLASAQGIKTIIITDEIIEAGDKYPYERMNSGEFLEYVRKL